MNSFHRIILIILTLVIPVFIGSSELSARKKGYRLSTKSTIENSKKKKSEKGESISSVASAVDADTVSEPEMVTGSFMVASQCPSCNNGYSLDQVVFTGFDKNQSSSKESFFIINNTDRTLTAVTLYIDYRTPDGRQLHKQFLKLSCSIPPGETRKADIPSWDTQHSFYYLKSQKNRRHPGNPFDIRFDPVALYLRF